jgi:hypothetical protein
MFNKKSYLKNRLKSKNKRNMMISKKEERRRKLSRLKKTIKVQISNLIKRCFHK